MDTKLVTENMSAHLFTIGWHEKMENAYNFMQSRRVRHLPVVNNMGEIIGMLSDRDVQRSMISQIERSSGRIISDETIQFDEESQVLDYMSWPAKSVEHSTDLRVVAERMVAEKLSSLLVCNGKRTIGIVTAEDLLKVLITLLADSKAPKGWTLEHIFEDTFKQLKNSLL